ncbi:MAG: hypothetical protein KatS3mg076_1815 [Candidatus Binatia bacterium]|nr:MAG: hypothetical protein KatS3mg076_1815 [Candidatus Binatia bacterium]
MSSPSFLARFVLWSAALFLCWHLRVADLYVSALAQAGRESTRLLAGEAVRLEGTGRKTQAVFPYQGRTVAVSLSTLADGILPFLALVAASSWLPVSKRLARACVGTLVLWLFHLSAFFAYPFFLARSGPIVDSFGAFWVVLGLVGLPFLLWLVLARGSSEAAKLPPERRSSR